MSGRFVQNDGDGKSVGQETWVRDGLRGEGLGHTLLLRDEGICERHQPALIQHMVVHLEGRNSLEETILNVINEIQPLPRV